MPRLILLLYLAVTLAAEGCRSLPAPPVPGEAKTASPTPVALPTPPPEKVAPGEGEGNIYRIGPGDVLKIKVYEEPEISGDYRVLNNGTISWTWMGNVEVGGLTVEEVKDHLRSLLAKDYIRQPRLEMDVEYHSQVVYFFGNVASPGINRLGEKRSLLQNLLQAGGPKVWGDSTITILRTQSPAGKQEKLTVSLQKLLSGEVSEDVWLQNGDIVTVSPPEAPELMASENRVYIVGAVGKPGSFPWHENLTALDVLMAAGGLADYASGNRARIVRGSGEQQEEIMIRFKDILDGEKNKNLPLLPGDLIIVPESIF